MPALYLHDPRPSKHNPYPQQQQPREEVPAMPTTTKLSKRERLAAALGVDPDRYSFDDLLRHVAEYVDETRQLEGVVEAALEALPGDLTRYDELVGGIRHLAAYGATWAEHNLRVHRTLDREHGPDRSGREWECAAERVEFVIGQLVQRNEELRDEVESIREHLRGVVPGVLPYNKRGVLKVIEQLRQDLAVAVAFGDAQFERAEAGCQAAHEAYAAAVGSDAEAESAKAEAADAYADADAAELEVVRLRGQVAELVPYARAGAEFLWDGPANGVPGYDGSPAASRAAGDVEEQARRMRDRIERGEFGHVPEPELDWVVTSDGWRFTVVPGSVKPDHDSFVAVRVVPRLDTAAASCTLDIDGVGGPKALRETMCVAQGAVLREGRGSAESRAHAMRLQRIADVCDQHRPLGPDGKHGTRLCTATCGCD